MLTLQTTPKSQQLIKAHVYFSLLLLVHCGLTASLLDIIIPVIQAEGGALTCSTASLRAASEREKIVIT